MINKEVIQLNDSNDFNSFDGCSYIKQRSLNLKGKNSLNEKVLNVLQKLGDHEPGELAIYGKVDAPMITISIKNVDNGVIHFPLYESDAGRIIKMIEQSWYGKATGTVKDPSVKTLWQLDAIGFEISNPSWDTFISDVLLPRIKKEMFTNCSFSAYLNGLRLYKTGSLLEVHHDSEEQDTMFGTLLIQLPSQFKGGQLNIHNNRKTKTMDFSSNNISNAFSTFFCTFYRDCLLRGLQILEGYRLCLIYNLISNQNQSILNVPQKHALETQLISILSNWNGPSKVVYALKHNYTESNLLFKHLRTTDRAVANFLLDNAKPSHFNVFLGILNKKSSGRYDGFRHDHELSESDIDFYSDDEDSAGSNTYTLSNLVGSDDNRILKTSSLTVSFYQEVIPVECFEDNEISKRKFVPKENSTFEVCKYYRIAVIVILPKHHLLEILKRDGATSFDIDMIFLKEIEEQRGWENDERTKATLLAWSGEILSLNNPKSLNIMKGIAALNNLELIKTLFGRCVVLNESSTRILEGMCKKYGWETFASEIQAMFNKLSKEVAVQLLGQLIATEELQKEKQKICHDVFKIILSKFEDVFSSHTTKYVPSPTLEVIMKRRENDQDVLLSICRLSQMISYNMLEFAKTKSVVLFVPVLLILVSEQTKKLDRHWLEIAEYYLQVMENEASKPSIVPNWQRMDTTSCFCNDCLQLNGFLRSDIHSVRLKIGKLRRRHLQEQINCMENICYETDSGGNTGVLLITKTTKTGDAEAQNFSKTFLEKLRVIL